MRQPVALLIYKLSSFHQDMNRIYILLAAILTMAATSSCNHGNNENPYAEVAITKTYESDILDIDWDSAEQSLKEQVKSAVNHTYIINSAEEIPDFPFFPISKQFLEIDYSKYTLIVDYDAVTLPILSVSHRFYLDYNRDMYVLSTTYTVRTVSGDSESHLFLTRNAILVDKLPAQSTVTTNYGLNSPDIWD